MKIVVVGPGAMGCLFSSLLARTDNNEICLLGRKKETINLLKRNGIRIYGLSNFRIVPGKIAVTGNPGIVRNSVLVIIFVKSYDTVEATKRILPYVSPETLILTLQNGLYNSERITGLINRYFNPKKAALIAGNIFAGTTSHGATAVETGVIRHSGIGETVIGPARDELTGSGRKLAMLKAVFESSGINLRAASRLSGTERLIWSKLVMNSAINITGAVTGLRNGELIASKPLKELLCSVTIESASVARGKKIKLLYNNPRRRVVDICRATAGNYNSMLQDVLNGKMTEVESINGALINEGAKLGIKLPLNEMLVRLLKWN